MLEQAGRWLEVICFSAVVPAQQGVFLLQQPHASPFQLADLPLVLRLCSGTGGRGGRGGCVAAGPWEAALRVGRRAGWCVERGACGCAVRVCVFPFVLREHASSFRSRRKRRRERSNVPVVPFSDRVYIFKNSRGHSIA